MANAKSNYSSPSNYNDNIAIIKRRDKKDKERKSERLTDKDSANERKKDNEKNIDNDRDRIKDKERERNNSYPTPRSASNSALCSAGRTFSNTRLIFPSVSIKNVVRSTPSYSFPMNFFGPQTW